jgi:phage host-nuclease inhibitor protein Gam
MREKELEHLAATLGWPREQTQRLLEEVATLFHQTVEEYVRSRHAELRRAGMRNEAIYRQIREEIRHWRFRAPELSLRQIRRLIYG